jgi:hypothetical protein
VYLSGDRVNADDNIAVAASPVTHLTAPLANRAIYRSACSAQQISRPYSHFANLVSHELSLGGAAITRADGLIYIRVMGDRANELA